MYVDIMIADDIRQDTGGRYCITGMYGEWMAIKTIPYVHPSLYFLIKIICQDDELPKKVKAVISHDEIKMEMNADVSPAPAEHDFIYDNIIMLPQVGLTALNITKNKIIKIEVSLDDQIALTKDFHIRAPKDLGNNSSPAASPPDDIAHSL